MKGKRGEGRTSKGGKMSRTGAWKQNGHGGDRQTAKDSKK